MRQLAPNFSVTTNKNIQGDALAVLFFNRDGDCVL
jgi:hypothetical protein